jgi:cyanate permease
MFISPIVVGSLRDLTGSFIPGLAVCAAASWTLLLAGILLPRNATGPQAETKPSPQD